MHQVTIAQGAQSRLHHANVAFHPTKQNCVAIARQPFQHGAEDIAAEAGECLFVDSPHVRQQGGDFGYRFSQSLRILRAHQRGNFQNPSQADQQLRVLEQLLFLHYWRQKLLLDIDHDERALAGIQSTAHDVAVFAGDRTDIPENGRHEEFPNKILPRRKARTKGNFRWPFVLTAVHAAHKIKAAERFCSLKIAPSFNGRTADSGSAYRGSNAWGAAKSFQSHSYCTHSGLWGLLWVLSRANNSACSRLRSSTAFRICSRPGCW